MSHDLHKYTYTQTVNKVCLRYLCAGKYMRDQNIAHLKVINFMYGVGCAMWRTDPNDVEVVGDLL